MTPYNLNKENRVTELQKAIASMAMRIGEIEGFIEASTKLLGDLLHPAYQEDLNHLLSHYQESVKRLEEEIEND